MNEITKQSSFKREVDCTKKQLQKLNKAMEAVELRLEIDDRDGAYLEAFDFADKSEKLTLTARDLPAYTGHPQARKTSKEVIADNIPVRIGFTSESWFGVVIPALLPKKHKGSPMYIYDFLYPAMQNFFCGKQPVRYENCVIIFRHIYKYDRPERHYRDHDNIELNAVTDVIALYVMYDDAPLMCEHYYCSASGNENRTEVLVVPQNEFMTCYANLKSNNNEELILYENRP